MRHLDFFRVPFSALPVCESMLYSAAVPDGAALFSDSGAGAALGAGGGFSAGFCGSFDSFASLDSFGSLGSFVLGFSVVAVVGFGVSDGAGG